MRHWIAFAIVAWSMPVRADELAAKIAALTDTAD